MFFLRILSSKKKTTHQNLLSSGATDSAAKAKEIWRDDQFSKIYYKSDYDLALLMFYHVTERDASEQPDVLNYVQNCKSAMDSIFHCTFSLWHKSKRPVNYSPAAEKLAANQAIDKARHIVCVYSELLRQIGFCLSVVSKDLVLFLSTRLNSIEWSIHAYVAWFNTISQLIMRTKLYEYLVNSILQMSWWESIPL